MTRFPGLAAAVGGLAVGLIAVAAVAQTAPAPAPGVAPVAAIPTVPGAPPIDPSDPWMWGDVAVLRGLDKVTAETRDFEARAGEDVAFLGLTVSMKRCAKRPPERQPEVIVGMEIADRRSDGEGGSGEAARIFSGWMFGSSPALNPLEHPVYDIWVLDCINSLAPVVEPAPVEAEEEADEPVAAPLPGQVFD